MALRRKVVVAGLLVAVGFGVWLLGLPMLRFSAARKKYVIGMSLEQAQRIAKPPFAIDFAIPYPVSPEWKSGEVPEPAKQTVVVGVMHSPRECIVLGFNSYSNLVEIQPINDPIDFALWLRSRK